MVYDQQIKEIASLLLEDCDFIHTQDNVAYVKIPKENQKYVRVRSRYFRSWVRFIYYEHKKTVLDSTLEDCIISDLDAFGLFRSPKLAIDSVAKHRSLVV